MRFVLANILLFSTISGILYYQYFFQSPDGNFQVSMASQIRAPAATRTINPTPLVKKVLNTKALVAQDWKFNLNCKDSNQVISRSSDSLILNLKKCEKEFPKQIVVENETNGFTASLFPMGVAYSKTDSIPLKKGRNIIVIKYLLARAKNDVKSASQTEIVEKLSIEH